MPQCTKCHRPDLTDDDFHRYKDGRLRRDCKDCCALYQSIYYAKNRRRLRQAHKQWRAEHYEQHLATMRTVNKRARMRKAMKKHATK